MNTAGALSRHAIITGLCVLAAGCTTVAPETGTRLDRRIDELRCAGQHAVGSLRIVCSSQRHSIGQLSLQRRIIDHGDHHQLAIERESFRLRPDCGIHCDRDAG